jgi:hypothetical protein
VKSCTCIYRHRPSIYYGIVYTRSVMVYTSIYRYRQLHSRCQDSRMERLLRNTKQNCINRCQCAPRWPLHSHPHGQWRVTGNSLLNTWHTGLVCQVTMGRLTRCTEGPAGLGGRPHGQLCPKVLNRTGRVVLNSIFAQLLAFLLCTPTGLPL